MKLIPVLFAILAVLAWSTLSFAGEKEKPTAKKASSCCARKVEARTSGETGTTEVVKAKRSSADKADGCAPKGIRAEGELKEHCAPGTKSAHGSDDCCELHASALETESSTEETRPAQ